MKIIIASDIHGSWFYCQKLLNSLKLESAEKLVLLGDILYHGPRNDLPKDYSPKHVIPALNEIKDKIICVKGNCDAEVDGMVLDFPITEAYTKITFKERDIYFTHGHKYNIDNPLEMKSGDVLVYGHTHVPLCAERDGIIYMNPGSVSIPKENSAHGYIVFDDGTFTWKDFEGNTHMNFSI